MSTASTYSPAYRTLAFFGFLADVHAHVKGTHDEVMQNRSNAISAAVTSSCPTKGWNIVWGPTIWWADSDSRQGGDHCWFVTKNESFDPEDGGNARTVYIVSIAGTNTNGRLQGENWNVEDEGIGSVVDADSWLGSWGSGSIQSPSGQQASPSATTASWIALGTATGAYILATTPGNGPNGPKVTLIDYLRDEATANPEATFIISGHSLGGALTPVVAMGLQNVIEAKLLAFPMAGPTPGNNAFADKYNAAFSPIITGSNSIQQINVNTCNIQDIVPMAWNQLSNINNIYTFREVGVILKGEIEVAIVAKEILARKAGIEWAPLTKILFTGGPVIGPGESTLRALFLTDILPQHVDEYLKIFGFPGLLGPEEKKMIGFAAVRPVLGRGVQSVEGKRQ